MDVAPMTLTAAAAALRRGEISSVALTQAFLERIVARDNDLQSYLTIAVGCTGGRHRSVIIARALWEHIKDKGHPATLTHRDIQNQGVL